MGKLISGLVFSMMIFPPLYIALRFLKWSWRSLEKELSDDSTTNS